MQKKSHEKIESEKLKSLLYYAILLSFETF